MRLFRHSGSSFIRFVTLALFLAGTLLPFYWMLVTSLKSRKEIYGDTLTIWPKQLTWANYATTFQNSNFPQYFANSALVSIVTALLVPFRLPYVAIFPVPLLVWAVAALVVLSGIAWDMRDRVIGGVAPLVGYCVGGAVVGGLRAPDLGLDTLIAAFHEAAGAMFIIGTAIGACWLGFRLLNP